ncbi:MAG: hypothetical protein HY873_11960 [Chloroflexi bacterium]|nr:hypothetical protein [Chloroflexota bacterium]
MKRATVGLGVFVLAAIMLAFAAAGCSDSESDTPAPSAIPPTAPATVTDAQDATAAPEATPVADDSNTIDPCSLITQSEAESAFGSPALAPEPKGAVCRYDTAEQTKFFDLSARAGGSSDFESLKNLCSSDTQPVAGLGDSSCSANNTIVVLAKGVLISIIAGGVFNQDDLRALAELAVSRLP